MELDRRKFTIGATALAGLATLPVALARTAYAIDQDELLETGALDDMILGAEDAPVTIIEYASATCPHCAAFHNGAWPALKEKDIETGKARFIFREFPFDDAALVAFMLARCAGEDKYFAMIDVLFEQQRVWAARDANVLDELFKISRLAGFTEESFQACIRNEELARGIREIKDRGALNFAVRSTPTFFINGERVEGNMPIDRFDEMINDIIG